jgi:uncharacterized membrane protein
MAHISDAFEWIAVAVLIAAFVVGVVAAAVELGQGAGAAYRRGRAVFGRGILLALEILIAADLIRTVAVEPTLENIGVLGLIVVVRTLLSFSIDVEIDGVLPWRKHAVGTSGEGAPSSSRSQT